MIYFKDWVIWSDGRVAAHQFDHLTRTLVVMGELPRDWEWVMIVKAGGYMDYLPLSAVEGGMGTVLTAQQLSCFGSYELQLRGTKGELVRHTNMICAYVAKSLSGDIQWPEVPSQFTELERRVTAKAEEAEGFSTHPPVIGANGSWWLWDSTQYVDSGVSATGPQGEQGSQGVQGADGYIPERGVDYWTDEDITQIKSYVEEAILGGAW